MSMPFGDETRSLSDFDDHQQKPRQGLSTWVIVLIVLGVLGSGFLVLCCGGGVAFLYFGMQVFSEEIANELRDNPTLIEHVGNVESFEIDWIGSAAADGESVFLFDVKGSKADGVVTCESITLEDGTEYISWAELELLDGTSVDLVTEENLE